MRRGPRLIREPFALWDVRDVEAHVRVLQDAKLNDLGAHLDQAKYDDLLTYLLETCWELSGLDAAGEQRLVWWVEAFTDADEIEDAEPDHRSWFLREDDAEAKAAELLDRGMIVGVEQGPPAGAYDPDRGLSFSTYSRRILSARVVDWFRKTLGDSRYAGGRHREVSLEAIAERYEAEGEAPEQFLDNVLVQGGIDEFEEVVTHVWLETLELSGAARASLEEIGLPMAERAASVAEIASELGLDRKEVLRRRDELADVLRVAGL